MNIGNKKLSLRKESLRTLSTEDLSAAGGAAGGAPVVVLGTAQSICRICYPKPVFTYQTTPEVSIITR
jgi:hypothetical protein